jgi:hypothetical protein
MCDCGMPKTDVIHDKDFQDAPYFHEFKEAEK